MRAIVYGELGRFWGRVRPLFEGDPVEHNVGLIALNAALAEPAGEHPRRWLVAVEECDRLVGAAFSTDDVHPLGVSALPAQCAPTVAEVLHGSGAYLHGVAGRADRSIAFAETWHRIAGVAAIPTLHTRLYRLGTLAPPSVPGTPRLAGPADAQVVGDWLDAFRAEALHGRQPESPDPAGAARRSMSAGNVHLLWEHAGTPVAHAMLRRPTDGLTRVSSVYTPPEHRGRGYGAAVTAAVSEHALAHGAHLLVLFADQANPTTNAIYQRIGYRVVCENVEYTFAEASTTSEATAGTR